MLCMAKTVMNREVFSNPHIKGATTMFHFKFKNHKGYVWWIRGTKFATINAKLEEMGITTANGWVEISA